jgi:endonuclease/exonuclease/phosphatase family metal-dependent hydrolase
LQRIASVLDSLNADIICLQEVDRSLPRSSFSYQAEHLASGLGFQFAFYANFGVLLAGMGNAILSRYPLYSTWNITLPFAGESRGLLHTVADTPAGPLTVFCTHWGLSARQRAEQTIVTASKVREATGNIVLCGDLNAASSSAEIISLLEHTELLDAGPAEALTYPADAPTVKIDYVLASPSLLPISSAIYSQSASDHHPVFADFRIDHHQLSDIVTG